MAPGVLKLGVAFMGLALVLAALSAAGERGVGRVRRLQAEVERVEALNARLEEHNRLLVAEIHALKTDPRMLEAVARDDLGLVRPGEVVFRFESAP